jgi:hypothetical protein
MSARGLWRKLHIGFHQRPDGKGVDVIAEPDINGTPTPICNNVLVTLKWNGAYYRHPGVNPDLGFPLDDQGRVQQY